MLVAPKFEETTLVVLLEVHCNWLLPPAVIDDGVAVRLTVGAPGTVTVTVAVADACCPLLLTVMV